MVLVSLVAIKGSFVVVWVFPHLAKHVFHLEVFSFLNVSDSRPLELQSEVLCLQLCY